MRRELTVIARAHLMKNQNKKREKKSSFERSLVQCVYNNQIGQ